MAADLKLFYAVTSTGKHSLGLMYNADKVSFIYSSMPAIIKHDPVCFH